MSREHKTILAPGRETCAAPTEISRRRLLIAGAAALTALPWADVRPLLAARLDISNHYSRRNQRRPARPQTRYIILHTTEGATRGSLRKIKDRGEAHYFVTPAGKVYRIIHKSKIAKHAGRSMWDGHRRIDEFSIGIEVVGYHNRDITEAQYRSLRELLRQLKSLYRIPDRRILTHSMVAYGRPNRFHPHNHRGRKRCGMIFARHDVRRKLGLEDKPLRDSDVEAGRLRVADPELFAYLFAKPPRREPARLEKVVAASIPEPEAANVIMAGKTAWFIAREKYDSSDTRYIFPNGRQVQGDEIEDWGSLPVGTQVLVEQESEAESDFEGFIDVERPTAARALAGESFQDSTTIYFLPNGMVRTGREMASKGWTRRLLQSLPKGTRILVGYVYGGHVKGRRFPERIAGAKWNYPSTFYRLPDGRIVSGDDVDAKAIPSRTLIFYQS